MDFLLLDLTKTSIWEKFEKLIFGLSHDMHSIKTTLIVTLFNWKLMKLEFMSFLVQEKLEKFHLLSWKLELTMLHLALAMWPLQWDMLLITDFSLQARRMDVLIFGECHSSIRKILSSSSDNEASRVPHLEDSISLMISIQLIQKYDEDLSFPQLLMGAIGKHGIREGRKSQSE